MKRDKTTHARSLKLAGVFSVLFVAVICIGIITRVVILFTNSTFDGKHQFILFDVQKDRSVRILIFSPAIQSIVTINVAGVNTLADMQKTLQLPYDAVTYDPKTVKDENPQQLLERMFTHFSVFRPSGINQADIYRLWFFAKSVPNTAVTTWSISLSSVGSQAEVPARYYIDNTLFQEADTITVINATGVSGVGNAFAGVLTTIGGNVISVETADTTAEHTIMYVKSKDMYAVKRISELFHILPTVKPQPLSDIIITIGSDSLHLPYFSR